jgi:putative methionine-R-sulfoxide reductase with GAF domain/FixJ family two-component response regulator
LNYLCRTSEKLFKNEQNFKETMTTKLNILLIDDQEDFRGELKIWLEEKLGHIVTDFPDGKRALLTFQENPDKFDLVLADYYLPGDEISNGIALLSRLKEKRINLPVIIITGGGEQGISEEALKAGAFWYLEKPINRVETEVLINSAGRLHAEDQQIVQLRKKTEDYYHPSLITLSQALLEEDDITHLVRTINQRARIFLEAASCHLVLLNDDTGKIENAADWQESKTLYSRHYDDRLLTKELVESGSYHIVPDVMEENNLNPQFIASGIRAFAGAACPQKAGARAVFYVYFTSPLDQTDETKLISNLIRLAQLIGLAIERIHQEELTEAVVKAGQGLLSARSNKDIYSIVRKTISQSFQISTFFLATCDGANNHISFPLAFDKGKECEIPDYPNTKEEGGFAGHIIRTGKDLTINNQNDLSALPVAVKIFGEKTPPQIFFGVPLKTPKREIVGAISIQRYVPRQFFKPPKQALRTLATLVASALDRLNTENVNEKILKNLLNRPLVETLEEIAHEVQSATRADIVTLHPYDANRKLFMPERIRLGLVESEARSRYYGSEIKALGRLLEKDEHFAENSSSDPIFRSKFIKEHKIISSCGITLKAGNPAYPIGVLVINFKTAHRFNESSKEILRYYARRAVLAVHLGRLAQQERMAMARTSGENEALRVINSLESPYTDESRDRMVMDVIHAIESVWSDIGDKIKPTILFSDPIKRKLVYPEMVIQKYNINVPEQKGREDIRFGEGICGWVAETGQSLLVSNVKKDPHYLKLIRNTQSEICVPIKLGNRLLGVLDVEAPLLNFFEDADRILLERIANAIAIALGAAGHRKGANRVIQAALDAVRDPGNALNILVKRAQEIANYEDKKPNSTTLFLRTSSGLKPVAAYPEDILPRVLDKIGPAIALTVPEGQRKGIVVRAFSKAESQLVRNVQEDPDYILFDESTKAELDVPIFSGVEVIGVLNVEYTDAEDLNAEDQLLLESLAAQTSFIATIRRQADALADTERRSAEATALALMGIAFVDQGHRWKTAASTVAGTRDLLEMHLHERWNGWKRQLALVLSGGHMGPDPVKAFQWLERMKQSIEISQERPKNPFPTEFLENIPVNSWLRSLMVRWKTMELDVHFVEDLRTSDEDCINANRFWLTRGLENLIANAVRASQNNKFGRNPTVVFYSALVDKAVTVQIQDNGSGIPEKVRPYLFTDTIPDGVGRLGHGVGCLTTQFIVRLYGGNALLLKTGDEGTIVAIDLPANKTYAA